MTTGKTFGMGELVEECYAAATLDYCNAHRGTMAREEAYSALIANVQAEILFFSRGRVNVTVMVRGWRRNADEMYFWRLQKTTNSTYRLEGGTLDL